MKTLYLRIGSDKAGTVSMANLAENNKEVLLRHGVYSPGRNCIHLVRVLADRLGLESITGFDDRSHKRRKGIEELLARYPSEVSDTIFLTTETIWGRFSKRDLTGCRTDILDLLRGIAETFYKHRIKIILHLRPMSST